MWLLPSLLPTPVNHIGNIKVDCYLGMSLNSVLTISRPPMTMMHVAQQQQQQDQDQQLVNRNADLVLSTPSLPPTFTFTSLNIYPFNIFRSASNDKCLAVNNDGVYLDNCNLNNIKHQWNISPDENICVMK